MTSEEIFSRYGNTVTDSFADLYAEDINLDAIDKDMLGVADHDGKLMAIPMGKNAYGIVVNKTLLEKEGLTVPTTYSEFVSTLRVLADKGYAPIQGPDSKVYAELTLNMALDMILSDDTLYENLMSGNDVAADMLMPVMDRLDAMIDNGYTDMTVNHTYPQDNYDQAILTFFEGNVPYWVCNTEKVSGMKKRETKSESFKAAPFEYTFIYAPMGENGAYVYTEPWFGFSVNKNSANYDYAVEFMRFLATKDELNTIAGVKGVPSVAVEDTDAEIYQDIKNPAKTELSCVNEGKITPDICANWYSSVNAYVSGEIATGRDAMLHFVSLCSGKK